MKKLIITCVLVTSASIASFAQAQAVNPNPATAVQSPPPQQRPLPSPEFLAERRAKMYQQQLGLTPEQYKSVYDVEVNFVKQQQAFRANGAQPKQEDYAKVMATKDESYKKIFTPEQYTKYSQSMGRPVPAAPNPNVAAPAGK